MKKTSRVAIVYDWIDRWGGAERVLLTLAAMFPNATFFTSYANLEKAPWAKNFSIRSSFIQHLPGFIKKNRVLSVPFYQVAFESFDFSPFDLVISISSSFAKGIITRPETPHICYLLTPTRFLWLYDNMRSTSRVVKTISRPLFNHLRNWDKIAAFRPDKIISISKTVQKRTKDIYGVNSEIIYPPFDIDYWDNLKMNSNPNYQLPTASYHLVVSRLEPYKRVNLVVDTFNKLPGRTLVIVGNGSQLNKLQSQAQENVTFLKDISNSDLASLYQHAEALIMPQEEDFGLVSLEAQFFGCPVIAYKVGGAAETVIKEQTGLFFDEQTINSLQNALVKYDTIASSLKQSASHNGPKNVEKFSKNKFINKFRTSIFPEFKS